MSVPVNSWQSSEFNNTIQYFKNCSGSNSDSGSDNGSDSRSGAGQELR